MRRRPLIVLCAALVLPACDDAGGPCERYYVDGDGDGAGAASGDSVCGPTAGYVATSDDCDDARADVHPGVQEDCGPVDLDCDGDATAGAPGIDWYGDPDGDGFASPVATVLVSCFDPGAGYTTQLGDCAPEDPARSPDATEIHYNGLDDDCDATTPDGDRDGDGSIVTIDCDDDDPSIGAPGNSFVDVAPMVGIAGSILKFGPNAGDCLESASVGGAAVGDIDGDGFWDVYIAGLDGRGYLHRNDGGGTFTNVTTTAGLLPIEGGSAGVFADFDADGDSDLFVTSVSKGASQLYINDGTGHFSEEAVARGADAPVIGTCGLHLSVTAADVDGDGDVDIHLPSWFELPLYAPDGRVLLNDGTGHFTTAPSALGLTFEVNAAYTPAYADFDGDGRRDLAFTGDFATSGMRQAVGDGALRSFVDVTSACGVGLDENGMGSTVADYDGDGDLDWFVTAIYPTALGCYPGSTLPCMGNRLYRNRGDGHFDEVASLAGVSNGGWGWGTAFFDFDHDGDLDLGNTNGFSVYGHDVDRIRMFVSDGTGGFADHACELGMAANGQGRAFIPFDFDADGDLDVLTTENGTSPHLYRNDVGSALPWLRVRLADPSSKNTEALGATVWLRRSAGGSWVRREIHANSTFGGVAPAEAHFGLGAGEAPIAELRIVWPDGAEQLLTDVGVRQALRILRAP